jgi:hypothetical protein
VRDKQQYFNQHRNLCISKNELERKWKVREVELQHLSEAEFMSQLQMMSSAALAPTAAFLNNYYFEDYVDDYIGM